MCWSRSTKLLCVRGTIYSIHMWYKVPYCLWEKKLIWVKGKAKPTLVRQGSPSSFQCCHCTTVTLPYPCRLGGHERIHCDEFPDIIVIQVGIRQRTVAGAELAWRSTCRHARFSQWSRSCWEEMTVVHPNCKQHSSDVTIQYDKIRQLLINKLKLISNFYSDLSSKNYC